MKIAWYTKNKGRLYVNNMWIGNVFKDNNGNIHLDNVTGKIINNY